MPNPGPALVYSAFHCLQRVTQIDHLTASLSLLSLRFTQNNQLKAVYLLFLQRVTQNDQTQEPCPVLAGNKHIEIDRVLTPPSLAEAAAQTTAAKKQAATKPAAAPPPPPPSAASPTAAAAAKKPDEKVSGCGCGCISSIFTFRDACLSSFVADLPNTLNPSFLSDTCLN